MKKVYHIFRCLPIRGRKDFYVVFLFGSGHTNSERKAVIRPAYR